MRRSGDILGLDSRTALLYLALFAVAMCSYALLWPDAPRLHADTAKYMEAAQDLADGRLDRLQFRTPGFPLVLLLTGSAWEPQRILFYLALVLYFASIWMMATVLRRHGFGRRPLAAFAALLLTPAFAEQAAYVLSENVTQFTLVAGFAAVIHWQRTRRWPLLVIASCAFAYSGLTRPTYQVVAVAAAACLAFCLPRRELLRATTVLLLGTVLLVGGYVALNGARFGYFGVTPMLGFHLSTKTVKVIERLPDEHAAVRQVMIAERNSHLTRPGSSMTGYMYIWSAIPALQQATGMDIPQLSAHMQRLNLRLIAAAPLEYLHEIFRAFNSYWFPAFTPNASLHSRALQLLLSALHFAILAAFAAQCVLLAGALAYLRARGERTGIAPAAALSYTLAAAVVFYTMAVSILVESGVPRVRTPADIFMIYLTFQGYQSWWKLVRRESEAPRAMAFAAGERLAS